MGSVNWKNGGVVSGTYSCTRYCFKDGNNRDNFATLWNVDKIFGMFDELDCH